MPKINNEILLDFIEKKEKILENNYDFIVVPPIVWQILVRLYSGGPEITY